MNPVLPYLVYTFLIDPSFVCLCPYHDEVILSVVDRVIDVCISRMGYEYGCAEVNQIFRVIFDDVYVYSLNVLWVMDSEIADLDYVVHYALS